MYHFSGETLMLGDVKGFQVTASEWQNPGVNHYVRHPPGGAESFPPWVAEPVAFLQERQV